MSKTKEITIGYDPTNNPRQVEAHKATETYILYGGAKGGGKTAYICGEGIRLSLKYPGNRGWMGCRIATDFRDNALKQLIKFLPPQLAHHHQTHQYFELKNGSVIMYGGLGNDAEAYQALNNMPELGWFAIDQAEQITETQFQLLCGALRLNLPSIHYRGMLTANPEPGWLRDRFIENCKPDHRFIPALPKDNPFLPADYEQRLRDMYPEALVKRLVEGIWDVDISGDYLIPYEDIRDAINRNLEPDGDKIAGVDVSRFGQNETVFLLKQGDKVLHIEVWGHQDTVFSSARVSRLIRQHKPVETNIDAIGIGVGVVDPLLKENFPVNAINVGEKATDHETYLNKRAEYYSLLARKFKEGTIDIPDDPKLASQLAGIRYDFNTRRQMFLVSKKEDKKKSVDYADALMLAFATSYATESPAREAIGIKFWG